MENDKIYLALKKIGEKITVELINILAEQGHTLTGALEESIINEISDISNGITLTSKLNYYGRFIETGVPKERIPFYPGSGNKTSKYIIGLINFAQIKFGLDAKKAKGVAFAIAYKQKFETGMPTRGVNFTQFIQNTLEKKKESITEQLNAAGVETVRVALKNMITNVQITLNQ